MILVVDDDPAQRRAAGALLAATGRRWAEAEAGEVALRMLAGAGAGVSLVLLDLSMPGMDGLEVLARLRPARPDLPVIVLTGRGSVAQAVEAMRAGASDFLIKPVSGAKLESAIRSALPAAPKAPAPAAGPGFDGLIAESPAMGAAIRLARKGARSSIPVL
ncbi:MAG: response regulator, partial [Pikeienuella sp.]